MTTADLHPHETPKYSGPRHRTKRERGVWNPLNIGLMILGFIFFTPIGLIILIGMIAGIAPLKLPAKMMNWFEDAREQFETRRSASPRSARSGNTVFDEYQQTQLDRIAEIRGEVREREQRFSSFKTEEQRAKEKKQFDRFMGRDEDL